MYRKLKDKLFYYFAEKNWGVRREYGPYVDAHREEHNRKPWKHWWMLIRLNWHYRIMRRASVLYCAPSQPTKNQSIRKTPSKPSSQRHLPYLEGAESAVSNRRSAIRFAKDLMQYDVVSFDIFDTLVLRPFSKPADMFMLMGKHLNRSEFYRIRTDAEKRAREIAMLKYGHREVTIQDIYAIIEERTGISAEEGIQVEFEIELRYCFANPYMAQIFRLLREQGKTIIIVSDMYLPGDMMAQLLEHTGYTGYEKLYVSCDYLCSKSNQSLYQYVKRDYVGKKIVHIGDNLHSDIHCAEKAGISTRYYENVHGIGNPYRADGMSELVGSAYAGIVNTHLHNGAKIYSPYYEYGFIYGGFYIFGFCNWMHEKAKKEGIDKILFLSRDGAIYQKVFNLLFDDVQNEYFLWSRIANVKYTLLKNREDFLKRMVVYRAMSPTPSTIAALLEALSLDELSEYLQDYQLKPDMLVISEIVKPLEQLFIDHWDLVCETFKEEKQLLYQYLSQKIGEAKKVAVVDVGWLGSGPMGIKYLVENEYHMGCQVSCWQAAARPPVHTDIITELMDDTIEPYMFSRMYNRNNFDTHTNTNRGLNSIFFEMLTQDVTPSYSGFSKDGGFIFDIPEAENYSMVREIHAGIFDFCSTYYTMFKKDPIMLRISGYDAYLPYRMIIRDLKFFKKHFSDMTFSRTVAGDAKNQRLETVGDLMKQAGY